MQFLVATTVLFAAAVASHPLQAQQPVETEPGEAVVQPGDQLEIAMFTAAGERLPEVSGTRIVDRSGRIFLPYVGSVEVRGRNVGEIRETLSERYASFYSDPVIDVEAEIRVNVTGAVRQPGNYFVSPTSTIVDALATAGGSSPEVDIGGYGGAADLSRVRLVRTGETRMLDLRPEMADPEILQLLVQSGDWIHVPPQPTSQWRSDLQLLSGIFSVAGSIAALVILIGG
ncbi:MAG: polysaccharide biosynthesis/export family protein [Longimicrobiales bacterium]|nr:polysaccharide biosynthesis/export family protein [Longimicrobiales bacterium]